MNPGRPRPTARYRCINCGRVEYFEDDDDAIENDWEILEGPYSGDKYACYERACVDRLHEIFEHLQLGAERAGAKVERAFKIRGTQWGKKGMDASR